MRFAPEINTVVRFSPLGRVFSVSFPVTYGLRSAASGRLGVPRALPQRSPGYLGAPDWPVTSHSAETPCSPLDYSEKGLSVRP